MCAHDSVATSPDVLLSCCEFVGPKSGTHQTKLSYAVALGFLFIEAKGPEVYLLVWIAVMDYIHYIPGRNI